MKRRRRRNKRKHKKNTREEMKKATPSAPKWREPAGFYVRPPSQLRIASMPLRGAVFHRMTRRIIEDSAGQQHFQLATSVAGPGVDLDTPACLVMGGSVAAHALIAAMSQTDGTHEILYVALRDITQQHWAQMRAELGLADEVRAALQSKAAGTTAVLWADESGCTLI